jgi:hypothetical protein
MSDFPNIEIKDDLEKYSLNDLRFIGKELGIANAQKLRKVQLIEEINKKQTKDTVNSILRSLDMGGPVGVYGLLIDFWFRSFKERKWATLIVTIIFFAGLFTSINYIDMKEKRELAELKKESLNFDNRIKELDEVEISLKNLIAFIENQKESIIDTESSLRRLQKEKNELEPIVNTDKETIQAILQQQEKRTWENRWIERFIGFGLGIAASIIASIIYGLIKRTTTTNKA